MNNANQIIFIFAILRMRIFHVNFDGNIDFIIIDIQLLSRSKS